MKFPFCLAVVLAQFYSSIAFSETLKVRDLDLASGAATLPRKLIQAGILKIGDLDLQDLVQKLQDPRSVVFHLLTPEEQHTELGQGPGRDQIRFGAHCFDSTEAANTSMGKKLAVKGGLILVDPRNLQRLDALTEDRLFPVLLHEGICAIFGSRVDDHYQISSLLNFMGMSESGFNAQDKRLQASQLPTYFPSFLYLKSPSKPTAQLLTAVGGVTGGGGGGDHAALFLKSLLFGMLDTLEQSCVNTNDQGPPCRYIRSNYAEIWGGLVSVHIEVRNDRKTSCTQSEARSIIPFESIHRFVTDEGNFSSILRIGPCQLTELLNTKSSITAAIQVMKLFWVTVLTGAEFPKAQDFGIENLGIFRIE